MTDYLITNAAALVGGTEDATVPGTFDPAYASHRRLRSFRCGKGRDSDRTEDRRSER